MTTDPPLLRFFAQAPRAALLLACCVLATACSEAANQPTHVTRTPQPVEHPAMQHPVNPAMQHVVNPAMQARSSFTTSDGVRIAYRVDGSPDRPVLVLSNSIATTLQMWDVNVPELAEHFRVVRFDTRGHGASAAPPAPYALARLGQDVLELMDHLHVPRAHFLGLSLGGFIGQWLGIHAPERIDHLILSNTSPHLGPRDVFDQLIAQVLQAPNLSAQAEAFVRNWFPGDWVDARRPAVEDLRAMVLATSKQGLAGSYAMVRDTDLRQDAARITRPTLVIGGTHDTVTLPGHSEQLAATIPGAQLLLLPTVHLPNIEMPREYLDAVLRFLQP